MVQQLPYFNSQHFFMLGKMFELLIVWTYKAAQCKSNPEGKEFSGAGGAVRHIPGSGDYLCFTNLFISKMAETLNFFAPLRMMAGPIYNAKNSLKLIFFLLIFMLSLIKNGILCLFFRCACKTVFFIVHIIPIRYFE